MAQQIIEVQGVMMSFEITQMQNGNCNMHEEALFSFHYGVGEHQTDDIVIEVQERKWWHNDLEVGRNLFAFLRGSCHFHLSWSVYKLQLTA